MDRGRVHKITFILGIKIWCVLLIPPPALMESGTWGKSKLPEMQIKPTNASTVGAFLSLVQKSTTSDNNLVFKTAVKEVRNSMSDFENKLCTSSYAFSTSAAYLNDDINDGKANLRHQRLLFKKN